jgi:cytochrome c biogenesis protein CcdA
VTIGSLGIALAAGILSTLSPCVLPLIPMILAAAMGEHRLGPVALAAGLTGSFVAIGLFLATIGYSLGLDSNHLRGLAAIILIAVGLVLIIPSWQTQFTLVAGPISGWAENRFARFVTTGLRGQFTFGILLGIVWSPCVGPTLGAASVLASRGQSLGQVGLVMAAFGAGAALPLLLLGLLSREAIVRWRGHLLDIGKGGKITLGSFLVVLGGLILTGLDKRIETLLVDVSPAWLSALTTRF